MVNHPSGSHQQSSGGTIKYQISRNTTNRSISVERRPHARLHSTQCRTAVRRLEVARPQHRCAHSMHQPIYIVHRLQLESPTHTCIYVHLKVAHTRLPSAGFRSWSRFLAVSLQVTWVINPDGRLPLLSARPAVTPATLKRAATSFAGWWTEARWVWAVCLRLLPDSVAAAIWTRALLCLSPAR